MKGNRSVSATGVSLRRAPGAATPAIALLFLAVGFAGCVAPGGGPLGAVPPHVAQLLSGIPWLDSALSPDGPPVWPLPKSVSEALASVAPGFPVFPMPVAAPSAPLQAALAVYSAARGLPPPDPATLAPQITGLGLDPQQESILARLVLAYVAANNAQADAVAALSPEELRFLSFDSGAVSSWFAEDPHRTPAELDARIESLLGRVDLARTLSAGDLLARAADEARVALAGVPAPPRNPIPAPWTDVHALINPLGQAPPRASDPRLNLNTALHILADVLGVPRPNAPPPLPPDVDHALAEIVAAHAAGAQSENAAWQAHWVLDATYAALPILQSWSASLGTPLPGSSPSPQQSSTLGPDATAPGCVEPSVPPATPGVPPTPTLSGTGPLVAIPIPGVSPNCPANPWLLYIGGMSADEYADRAIIRVDLGGDDHYTGEVAGAATVITGRTELPNTTIGSINLDLGGNDRYDAPYVSNTQGFAESGFSLLLDAAGDDHYAANENSQGSVCCLSSRGPGGAVGPGGIGLLLDLVGSDEYTAGERSQGFAESGLLATSSTTGDADLGVAGLLVDVSGDDHYQFATQAVANACPANRAANDAPFDHTLSVLWDMSGSDHYESVAHPVNPNVSDAIFSTQGLGQCPRTGTGTQTAMGIFLDSRGRDNYTIASALPGGPYDASASMNNQNRSRTDGSMPPGGIGVFVDFDAGEAVDADGDGVPDALEAFLPGGALVYVPRTSDGLTGFFLPGLAVLGPGDDSFTEPADFVVDLGGNDLYAAPDLGGVRPYEKRIASTGLDFGISQPWFCSIVLDVGAGNDEYQPPERLLSAVASSTATTLYEVGTLLGGAATGLALLFDDGGANLFDSRVRVDARVTQLGVQHFNAISTALGVMQGAGMNGGVGILATWNATNQYVADVRASAFVEGGVSHPLATARGLSQGAGWYGVGLLMSFGIGQDHASVHVETLAVPDLGDGTTKMAVSQGAARGGAGILVDLGGRGSYEVDAPLAQGAGWTVADLTSEPAKWLLASQGPQGQVPYSALGILAAGRGDTTYIAQNWSQGVGIGISSEPGSPTPDQLVSYHQDRQTSQLATGFTTLNGRGSPAMGLLADLGGNDMYVLDAGAVASQGSGVLGGVGILFDASGDDAYLAPRGSFDQGAAVLGVGALLDFAGHDRYKAGSRAQGFASDDPALLVDLTACVGNPGTTANLGLDVFCTTEFVLLVVSRPDPNFGTSQAHATLLNQYPSLGLLVDRNGNDAYRTARLVQGVGEAHLPYTAQAGACKSPNVRVNTQSTPVAPFLKPCPDSFYPGSQPGRSSTPTDISPPPRNTLLLGLFVDANGQDRYDPVHAEDKKPVPSNSAVPLDGNNWTWRQGIIPPNDLNQTRLPTNIFQGAPPVGPIDPESVDNPGRLFPSVLFPGEGEPVIGLGVDVESLDIATNVVTQQVLSGLGVSIVRLRVNDAAGAPITNGQWVHGNMLLIADVELPSSGAPAVDRVDFLVDHEFLGVSVPVEGDNDRLRYVFSWNTTAASDEGLPLFPNGDHAVQASFFPAGWDSIESNTVTVRLSNPPTLTGVWTTTGLRLGPSLLAVSPTLGQTAMLRLSVSPDLEVPLGESVGPGERPGAYLDVRLEGPVACPVVPRSYVPSGPREITIDGFCGRSGSPDRARVPDGRYTVRVVATNGQGLSANLSQAVHIDGSPPVSRVVMPAIAGVDYRAGAQSLAVHLSFDDDHGVAGSGIGVTSLDLFRVHPNGFLERVGGGTTGVAVVSDGVATGETLRFVTVARDILGNAESPCLPGPPAESAPCVLAKIAAAANGSLPSEIGPRDVIIDFMRPEITGMAASHTYVAPGVTPVTFRAFVDERGSGSESVRIRFDDGSVFDLVQEPDRAYAFRDWRLYNGNRSGLETPYVYTITARDLAGNAASRTGTGTVDSLPPRLEADETLYHDQQGNPRPAGRGGGLALLRLSVHDASVARVEANVSAIDSLGRTQACSPDTRTSELDDWVCQFFLPPQLPDGSYAVLIRAVDSAGNENVTDAVLLVSDTLSPITEVGVSEVAHDHVTIRWRTPVPATSQVRYGKTAELGRSTPLDLTYATEHEVVVTGLLPSTAYFFAAASQNQGGRENKSAIFSVTTSSALALALPELREDDFLSGTVELQVRVTLRSGEEGARVTLWARPDDGSGVRQRLGTKTGVTGAALFTVNTSQLGDGPMRFLVEAERLGDFNDVLSPRVMVDNSAPILTPLDPLPEGSIAASRPLITLLVADSPSVGALNPSRITVSVGGKTLPVAVDGWEEATPQSRVRLRLADGVPPGEVELSIAFPDTAGNVGRLKLPVMAIAPDLTIEVGYEPGPSAARPGGRVSVRLLGGEGLGLTNASLDIPGWGRLPLRQAGRSWTGETVVPVQAADGRVSLVLHGTDAWGRMVERAVGEFVVDARAPRFISYFASPLSPSAIQLDATADEPVRLFVIGGERSSAIAELSPATRHSVAVAGMRPGTTEVLRLNITDMAGNAASVVLTVEMPTDERPPGLVGDLRVSATVDRVPLIQWGRADDDAGIASYQIHRKTEGNDAMFTVADSPFMDVDAPYGTLIIYTVLAIDVGGNHGPPGERTFVRAGGSPAISVSISPNVGSSETPFRIRAVYTHFSGERPDRIDVLAEGRRVSLEPVGDGSDCRRGCSFEAQLKLNATSQWGIAPLRIETEWRGDVTNEAVESPIVVASSQGLKGDQGNHLPAPSGWAVVALTVMILGRRRYRS